MRFRLRIYSPLGEQDFILPLGDFILGYNPQNEGRVRIPVSYVLQQHLAFTTTESGGQVRFVGDSGAPHDTAYNGRALTDNVPVALSDGDQLIIRDPADADKLIVLIFETLTDKKPPTSTAQPALKPPKGVIDDGGLKRHSVRLLQALPEIYQPERPLSAQGNDNDTPDNFLARFLGFIESILLPAEWTIANFDLFLDYKTAPDTFLPWLEQWFGFGGEWDEQQRRALLAHYPWRGTRRGLRRLLEVYTGCAPQIVDGLELPLFHFQVWLPMREEDLKAEITRASIERLIDATKPVHTTYQLHFAV